MSESDMSESDTREGQQAEIVDLLCQINAAKALIAQLRSRLDAMADSNYDAVTKGAIRLTTPIWMEDDDGADAA